MQKDRVFALPFRSRRFSKGLIPMRLLAPVLALLACLLSLSLPAQLATGNPPGDATADAALAARPSTDATWWKHAVIYEIYPRSFQDSNGDGVGDLNGITERLGYLHGLGIDAIWIAPMYPSPQVDFGYDISNYENVDSQYGTLADFDRLLREAKNHGIRILLDMVLNHTSDKHPWFIESASSRTNPRADWYDWNSGKPANGPDVTPFERRYEHDGPHGKVVPPNNWVSDFGGSAWEWVPARQQFYYHEFYKQQPDLNWSNPAVEKAMFGAMQFWLDRGVAGFRLDAIPSLFEDPQLRDEPELGGTDAFGDPRLKHIYTDNLPEVHATIRRMRDMIDKYPGNRVLIGETYLPNTRELDRWYGSTAHNELQLPMDMLVGFNGAMLNAAKFRRYISEVETQVHGSQPLLVFSNHDNERDWDRFGDGVHNLAIAKLIATVLLTPRATAMMYYGEELGMPTTTPTRVQDVKDPIGIAGWPKEKGRDGERTPMQWDSGNAQAGFSTDPHTWLPVPPNYKTVNVKTESADPNSLLNWYKQLIALRRNSAALRDGGIVMLCQNGKQDNQDVLSYVRTAPAGSASVVIAMNMGAGPQTFTLDFAGAHVTGKSVRTLLTSDPSLTSVTSLAGVTLPPYTVWIASLQ